MRTLFYCEILPNSSVEEGTSSGGISQSNTDYPKAVEEDSASNSSDNDLDEVNVIVYHQLSRKLCCLSYEYRKLKTYLKIMKISEADWKTINTSCKRRNRLFKQK